MIQDETVDEERRSGARKAVLLFLISSPLYQIHIGNGMPMTIARPASSELPPPYPSLAYISWPKRGKMNPRRDWNIAAPETALAVKAKASTRYR
jgi:hypothetical protein